jgi:hypothetical protein
MPIAKRKCHICNVLFVPEFDNAKNGKQLICSCKCALQLHKLQAQYKVSKRISAKVIAKMIGRRSMGEVEFDATYLEGGSLPYWYESDVFEYKVEESRKYTPDFKIKRKGRRRPLYIEYKGVLDVATRKKMKLFKAQYPHIDLRIVFQNARNKISKTSKTTYAMWAEQWGFKWANKEIPKSWLK